MILSPRFFSFNLVKQALNITQWVFSNFRFGCSTSDREGVKKYLFSCRSFCCWWWCSGPCWGNPGCIWSCGSWAWHPRPFGRPETKTSPTWGTEHKHKTHISYAHHRHISYFTHKIAQVRKEEAELSVRGHRLSAWSTTSSLHSHPKQQNTQYKNYINERLMPGNGLG